MGLYKLSVRKNAKLSGRKMSTGKWTTSAVDNLPVEQGNGQPNPHKYKILQEYNRNGFTLLEVSYPDCTNYEGRKILLFQANTSKEILKKNKKVLDPHFFDDKNYLSPIARFVPTSEGWAMGMKLMGFD